MPSLYAPYVCKYVCVYAGWPTRGLARSNTPMKVFGHLDILRPQPHAATVVHALLFWIDVADKASVRGAAKPPFSCPDGSPIFSPDEDWLLTSFDKRAEH